jgi:hypothetical protein
MLSNFPNSYTECVHNTISINLQYLQLDEGDEEEPQEEESEKEDEELPVEVYKLEVPKIQLYLALIINT